MIMTEEIIKILEQVEYELTCINGLYASDNEEFKNAFKLDYTRLIDNIRDIEEVLK